MARVTASQAVDKWSRRTKAAVPDYVAGVNNVTTAPGAAAARNQAGYLAGVQQQAPKWARNVAAVSLGDWQTAASVTGAGRIASGVDKAQNKMATVFPKLLSYVDQQVQALQSMPRGDLEQNLARAAAFARGMSKFQK